MCPDSWGYCKPPAPLPPPLSREMFLSLSLTRYEEELPFFCVSHCSDTHYVNRATTTVLLGKRSNMRLIQILNVTSLKVPQ